MEEQDLAARLVPCALPKLAITGDQRSLATLARLAGLEVPAMIKQHALWLLAEYLYKGEGRASRCMQWLP